MGMQSSAYVHVRPFSNEAAQRVKEIDLSEYNLDDLGDGWQETEDGLLWCRTEDLAYGRNDFGDLMMRIKDTLQDDGMAYLVELCTEDEPEATTYFYLGDAIRYVFFSDLYVDEDEEEDEELDCEDDQFIPSLEWDKTNVIGKSRKTKLTDEEKNVLNNHSW